MAMGMGLDEGQRKRSVVEGHKEEWIEREGRIGK